MPRANPARSLYCAARHALRHLEHPNELRRNPLVKSFAGSALYPEDLRKVAATLVRRAFARMAGDVGGRRRTRYEAILLRYDVLGHRRTTVAQNLGLSLSAFEIERRAAMRHFTRALAELVERRQPVTCVEADLTTIHLDCAARLSDCGDRDSAIALLDEIVRRNPDPAAKGRSLLRAAEVEIDALNPVLAERRLRAAQSLITIADANNDTSSLKRAHEAATLRWVNTFCDPAGAVGESEPDDALPQDNTSIDLLLEIGERAFRSGSPRAAKTCVELARSRAASMQRVAPRSMLELLLSEGFLSNWFDVDDPSAPVRYAEALAEAERCGYLGLKVFATYKLALRKWRVTRDVGARAEARKLAQAVETDDRPTVSQRWRCIVLSSAATSESEIGDPWRAASAARCALQMVKSQYDVALLKGTLAAALARGGRLQNAEFLADEAVEAGRSLANAHVVMRSLSTLATVACMRRDSSAAQRHLSEALGLAGRFGNLTFRARLYKQLTMVRSGHIAVAARAG